MPYSTIQIAEKTVTKTGAPERMRVEVEKSRKAFEIGRNSGLFRVPEVLEYDDASGTAVFERINGLVGIRPFIAFGNPHYGIIDTLADALSVIHQEMRLPGEMVIPLPSEYRAANEVFLHGDLSIDNVGVADDTSPLIIVDWQTTPLHGGRATYGTRYFDLAWFLNNLFNRPSYKVIFCDPIGSVARRFVDRYAKTAGRCFQDAEFASYLEQFFEVELPLVRSYTCWKTQLLLPRSQFLLRKFIRSLAVQSRAGGGNQNEYSTERRA